MCERARVISNVQGQGEKTKMEKEEEAGQGRGGGGEEGAEVCSA